MMMRAAAFAAVLLACACSTVGPVANDGIQRVSQACATVKYLEGAVPAILAGTSVETRAKVDNILSYVDSACNTAATIAQVVASDPTGGTDTATWVIGLGTGLLAVLPQLKNW